MVALPLTLPDTLVPFAPSATRALRLHGADVELAWIPERRLRAGQDRENRPAFAPCPADRIIAEEAYWQDDALALTPNKYPFGRDQRLLWMTRPAREPDLFARQTGFIEGFAGARDPQGGTAWLAHCPGAVAMARNEGPDTSRTDFYIVIGQAPRYLDRNMNVFGRVVHGKWTGDPGVVVFPPPPGGGRWRVTGVAAGGRHTLATAVPVSAEDEATRMVRSGSVGSQGGSQHGSPMRTQSVPVGNA